MLRGGLVDLDEFDLFRDRPLDFDLCLISSLDSSLRISVAEYLSKDIGDGHLDICIFLDLALDFDFVRSVDLDLDSRADIEFRFLVDAGVCLRPLVREECSSDGDLDICLFLDLALDFGLRCSCVDLFTDLDSDRSSLSSIGVFTFCNVLGQWPILGSDFLSPVDLDSE